MWVEPDYATWASHLTLSPHAIAYLILGATPSTWELPPASPRGLPPTSPEHFDGEDRDELRRQYERIYLPLTNAVESRTLDCPVPGKLSVNESMAFLWKTACENNWEQFLVQSKFFQAIQGRESEQVTVLKLEVERLERLVQSQKDEIEKLQRRREYGTPLLKWLDNAIEEFYFGEPVKRHPELTPWRHRVLTPG